MSEIQQFFWYCFKTGKWSNARRDRPLYFSGTKTDLSLRDTSQGIELYCRPALDYLPSVDSCLQHGISPQVARERGVSEHEFATLIDQWIDRDGACVVGYNAEKVDHVVMRFLFYRNLIDPYAWHGHNNNQRWDVIDLIRAVHVLNPWESKWNTSEDDKEAFDLGNVARSNGVDEESLTDAEILMELTKLIKRKHGELFEGHLRMIDHHEAEHVMSDTFLLVSEKLQRTYGRGSIMAPLWLDEQMRYVYAIDLALDPTELLGNPTWSNLMMPGSRGNEAIHWIKAKGTPFVTPFDLSSPLSSDQSTILNRMDLDLPMLQHNYKMVQKHSDLDSRVREMFNTRWSSKPTQDVDYALYEGFIPPEDRRLLEDILRDTENPSSRWESAGFQDKRLGELVFRFRARNFPQSLSMRESARWRGHCRQKIFERVEDGRSTVYERFYADLRRRMVDCSHHKPTVELLHDLEAYAKQLQRLLY